MASREGADAGLVGHRGAEAEEVPDQVVQPDLFPLGGALTVHLDQGAAGDPQLLVGAEQVEVVDEVAVAVAVGRDLDPGADLQRELEQALPPAVERHQAQLHHGFRDRPRVGEARRVLDLEALHCCWGTRAVGSPGTVAATLLGWK